MVFLLLGAGSETTTHLISGSVYELIKAPQLRLAQGGLEPRRSSDRGVFALRFAGAVHQAPLREKGYRTRRRSPEDGRQDHGHAGGRQHGPGGQPSSGGARPRAETQPTSFVWNGHPFLLGPPARPHRGQVRAGGTLQAVATPRAGGATRFHSLAAAARPQSDCEASGFFRTSIALDVRLAAGSGSGPLTRQLSGDHLRLAFSTLASAVSGSGSQMLRPASVSRSTRSPALSSRPPPARRGRRRHRMASQLGGQTRQPVALILRPAVFDHGVLAVDVTGLLKALKERRKEGRPSLRRSGESQ
jgi:hypothetical protein